MSDTQSLDEAIGHLEARAREYVDTADPIEPEVVRTFVRDWFDAIMARREAGA